MKKKFITNLALLLFLNLLVKPFWIFGVDRSVQNSVGETEYGFYFSLINLSLLLNIILDCGINLFNNRDIARHNQLLGKYLSNIFGLKFILAIFYFIVIFAIGLLVNYQPEQFKLLAILALNQFINSFILYLRSNISALHYFKTDSLISVLDRSLMIIICGLLLWGNIMDVPFKIEWFVYAQTLAYSITLVVAFIIVISKSGWFKIHIDRNYIIALLKQSYPFALLTLLMSSYTYVDGVMIERLLPDEGKFETGVYAQSFRIFYAFMMFGLLYAGLLLPMFSKMIKNNQPIGQLTQFSFLLLFVPAGILAISCIFYREEIIALLYPNFIAESPKVFGVLIISFIAVCFTNIFGTLLTANGNIKYLNQMAFFGVSFNIILNAILIPHYKAFGAAIASLATQIFTAGIQLFLAFKIFHFRVNRKLLFMYIIFFIGIIGLGYLSKQLNINWIYEFIAMIIISVLFAMVIKLINLKVFYQIIRFGDE